MKTSGIFLLLSTLILSCSSTWPFNKHESNENTHRRQVQAYRDLASRNAQLQMMNVNNFLISCNCIKLKHCNPIIEMVRSDHESFFSNFLNSQLQVYQCKYQKDEMYVCCPNLYGSSGQNQYNHNDYQHNINFYRENWQKQFSKMMNWNAHGYQKSDEHEDDDDDENDKRPHSFIHIQHIQPSSMPQYVSYPIQVFHPYSFPFTNKANNPYNFIANHEDPQTHKNCPPQITQEFTLPPNHTFFKENIQQSPSTTTTTTTTTNAPPMLVPWLPANLQSKTTLINHNDCGKSSSSRIIGGEDAGEGRFSWIARLIYRNKSNGKISHRCAGSLISHKYILTAGHCVSNLIDSLELALVRFGDEKNQEDGCAENGSCMKEEDFEIERVIVHPSYNRPRFQNDVALIRLRQSTESSSNLLVPICLPILNYERFSNNVQTANGIVAGYGATSKTSSAQSPVMKWIRLPFVETSTCASFYANYSQTLGTRILISNFQLCMQGREDGDACAGDSGGPLMSDVENERSVLLGIVSFGPRSCGLANFPGVYTKVASYLEWILQNIQK